MPVLYWLTRKSPCIDNISLLEMCGSLRERSTYLYYEGKWIILRNGEWTLTCTMDEQETEFTRLTVHRSIQSENNGIFRVHRLVYYSMTYVLKRTMIGRKIL